MRRFFAFTAVVALIAAIAVPAGAAPAQKSHVEYALAGEARGLEVAIGNEGISLGLALSRADSAPSALGVGAGQCTLLGEDPDPDSLPCTEESTSKTNYPGAPGDGVEICGNTLPAPLADVVDLRVACGSSRSGIRGGLPFSTNSGRVAHLGVTLPVGTVLDNLPTQPLVDQLTDTLSPVLDQTPGTVQDAVDNVLEIITGAAETEALAVELGPASSNIARKGKGLSVSSDAAGALIGIIGIPEGSVDGTSVSVSSDPLKNGLVIIEVGRGAASASADNRNANATAAASAAVVTVKVRDITKPEPTYVEVSVAPGESYTVLEGTPAESTIEAATATVEENGTDARAVANAVRLHLLKGVNGGVALSLGRATAAAKAEVVKPAPPIRNAPPEPLPFTGGIDRTLPALGLIGLAALAYVVRRRFGSTL